MSDAARRVLELVQSGEITSAQGWQMLGGLGEPPGPQCPGSPLADAGAASSPTSSGPTPVRPVREAIAVVGASASYPGAPDLERFWTMLDDGTSMVREVPPDRWDAKGLYSATPGQRGRVTSRWGAFLDGIDRFDPSFFNLSGRAAELMDPQQRLFLKGAWRALEDAGAAGSARLPQRCGVFVGVTESDYLSEDERCGSRAEAMTLLGSDSSILAARISYLLDLRGPSLAINTACSSSLVAVDLGCTSLLTEQSDLVVAGGVCLFMGPGFYLSASEGQMLSPTGACHTFDAAADGFVPGEGVGVVVLKRLADALAQGDRIRGLIRASGVNQDGKTNGLTAPSARAQEELERSVYDAAGISAESITLVEAHGTGTRLGDPVEVAALERAFRADTDRRAFCALGSIKTNIGHTAQAAGVAGILKVLMAMEHRRIPATLNFQRLNPQIELQDSPFYVADAPRAWTAPAGSPRRAAVSSFGYSGTNAHVLLEEAPEPRATVAVHQTHHLFVLSARTPQALVRLAGDLRSALRRDALDPVDLAFTLMQGRRHWPHRAAFVARNGAALIRHLADIESACTAHDDDAPTELVEAARTYLREGTAPTSGSAAHGRIVTLPGHPFDEASYWNTASSTNGERVDQHATASAATAVAASPLREVDTDRSAPGRRFRVDADHWWVADHRVAGRAVLAAASTLAMAHDAARLLGLAGGLRIHDVRWSRPVHPSSSGVDVLVEQDGDGFRFSIGAAGDPGTPPGCTGWVSGVDREPADALDGPDPTSARPVSVDQGYAVLRRAGLEHGEPFRALRSLSADDEAVLGVVEVAGRPAHLVDPGLLDSAFQAVVAARPEADEADVALPAGLGSMVLGPRGLGAQGRVVARQSGGSFSLVVVDESNRVRASITDFAIGSSPSPAPGASAVLARRVWSVVRGREVEPSAPAAHRLALRATGVVDLRTGQTLLGADLGDVLASGHFVVDVACGDEPQQVYRQVAGLLRAAAERQSPEPVTLTFCVPGQTGWAVAALASAVSLEHPLVRTRTIRSDSGQDLHRAVPFGGAVLHRSTGAGAVERMDLEAVHHRPEPPAWRPRSGTYVVTGGTGLVGRTLAAAIVRSGGHVTLLSRRGATEPVLRRIGPTGSVTSLLADVTSDEQVTAALDAARAEHGPIRGVVHAAGVDSGRSFLQEELSAARQVLAVKVDGARLLDEATSDDDLDFFVTCSSLVGLTGNRGQAVYSFANGCLIDMADERAEQVRAGHRRGHSLALAWGPWSGGGMADGVEADHGLTAIDPDRALEVWDRCLRTRESCLAVLATDADLVRVRAVTRQPDVPAARAGEPVRRPVAGTPEDTLQELVDVLSEELRLPRHQVVGEARLEALGIESVMVAGITARLLRMYESVPKTLFFEHRTVAELAQALSVMPRRPGCDDPGSPSPSPSPADGRDVTGQSAPSTAAVVTVSERDGHAVTPLPDDLSAVAIIGMAGRYPMAADLDDFWSNLRAARDCVTEIPTSRWSMDGFYAPRRAPLRSYSKWGSFIDGVDRFDPTFFRIAPAEAAMLDPQERLFLETSWHAVEDAGYVPADLPRRTGVWVGVMYGEYQLLGATEDGRLASSSYSSIANRVSYCLDLQGPSMAVDSMCSSSLTALHLACQSLRLGDADAAVVGGVNLNLHQRKYLQLSLAGFAASDGRCRSFGEGGDGYVPGEGVGALVLKPLHAAVRDGDPIRAVIRGSAINHGGQANGYTVPDPRAQADTVGRALARAGITARDVGYVEAHGTGTALGDPIEVRGLAQHFGPDLAVPMGSVKSNLGHLESAAGVAALTKVVLQMQHGELVPSLHAEPLNPDIDFGSAGVTVNSTLRPWPTGPGGLRRALVSSFGAGGSNASLVLEESASYGRPSLAVGSAQVLVLSADSPEQLSETARRLGSWMERLRPARALVSCEDQVWDVVADSMGVQAEQLRCDETSADVEVDVVARACVEDLVSGALGCAFRLDTADRTLESILHSVRAAVPTTEHHGGGGSCGPDLAAIAHTLRTGRIASKERLAVVAASVDQAVDALTRWLAGEPDGACRSGHVAGRGAAVARSVGATAEPLAQAEAWVRGDHVDWATPPGGALRVGGMPGRPFRSDRVWLDGARALLGAHEVAAQGAEPGSGENGIAESTPAPVQAQGSGADLLGRLVADLAMRAAARIGLDAARLDPTRALGDYGYESMTLKELGAEIESELGVTVDASLFYDLRGITELAEWMLAEHGDTVLTHLGSGAGARPDRPTTTMETTVAAPIEQTAPGPRTAQTTPGGGAAADAVAIVGLSGRFPQSPDVRTLWSRLRRGENLLVETPANRWDWRDFAEAEDNIFRWGGYLDDEDCFDAAFFGISDGEAKFIDPQQRLLLQESWAALEDAGYAPSSLAGSDTGVFAGVQFRDYQHLLHDADVVSPTTATGNEDTFAVNRISYLLDLHGPSEVVNTACSSSLVAVHRAVRSLRSGECTMALAGGVALNLTPYALQALDGLGVVSPRGKSRPLDARADGYVKGEGVGVVALKLLRAAIRDGDQIHAVIRGSATNHGGRATTLTSPNSRAQSSLLVSAMKDAAVPISSISYVEMHGTGTYVGDPVEVRALTRAFRELAGSDDPVAPHSCGLGSGKANFGHLEPASGIAGLIKLVGSLQHRELYGMPDFGDVNPAISLEGTPFRVVDRTVPWSPAPGSDVLRAGVSSFGIGGVNAHVVLEEALPRQLRRQREQSSPLVFPFSAKTPSALRELVSSTRARLDSSRDQFPVEDVSGTLVHGRDAMPVRCAVVATDLDGLLDGLSELGSTSQPSGVVRRVGVGEREDELVEVAVSWVQGVGDLREHVAPAHLSLPSYPFAATPHWFAARRPVGAPGSQERTSTTGPMTTDPQVQATVSTVPPPTTVLELAPGASSAGASLGPVGDGVRQIVAGVLGCPVEDVHDEASFKDLGVDSLMSIRVVEAIHAQYSDELSYSALTDHPTIRLLAIAIDPTLAHGPAVASPLAARPAPASAARAGVSGQGTKRRASLIPFTQGGPGQSSFWIPGAVGFAAAFTTLAGKIGPDYPFYAFQARGADDRSMPQLWDDMVDDYLDALIGVQPEGPYVIGGHSFGGLTAMALARRLHTAGQTVKQLVMIDTFPPTQEVFERHRGDYNDAFIIYYLANVLVDAEHHPERTIRESDLDGVPRELHIPTLAKMVHERSGGMGRAEDTYHYLRGGLTMSEHSAGLYQQAKLESYDASPVLFIKALDGFVGRSSEVYWPRVDMMQGYDYVQPWREAISTRVDLIEIDEDHLHIVDGSAADVVAAAVVERLQPSRELAAVAGGR